MQELPLAVNLAAERGASQATTITGEERLEPGASSLDWTRAVYVCVCACVCVRVCACVHMCHRGLWVVVTYRAERMRRVLVQ